MLKIGLNRKHEPSKAFAPFNIEKSQREKPISDTDRIKPSIFDLPGNALARTRRSLGHHLLHPLILRLLVLSAPADLEAQSTLL